MGLCVVMNRCAPIEGGANGGGGGKEERDEVSTSSDCDIMFVMPVVERTWKIYIGETGHV